MDKYILNALFLLLTGLGVKAQTTSKVIVYTSHEVVANANGAHSNANGSISFSIGEAVVGSLQSENYELRQGFQPPEVLIIEPVGTPILEELQMQVFPNPTAQYVHLQIQHSEPAKYQLALYDLMGKQIFLKDWNNTQTTIDLQAYPASTYLLVIQDEQQQIVGQYKIQKTK